MLKFVARHSSLSSLIRIGRACSQLAGSSNTEHVVCTTGYTYKTKEGVIGKYAVFFGETDDRNTFEEINGVTSHVAAKIYAVTKAIQLADDNEPLLIRSDLQIKGIEQLNDWAEKGFTYHSRRGLMANAKLLSDLHSAVKNRSGPVKFEFTPSTKDGGKNYVTELVIMSDKFRPSQLDSSHGRIAIPDPIPGEVSDAYGRKPKVSSSGWPVVYTGGILNTTMSGFKIASFCTIWPNKECSGPPQRLAVMPVTLFRTQLSAIEVALKQALDVKLTKVVVVTSCAHFIRMYKDEWRRVDKTAAANRFLYERIRDLARNHGMNVHFRYELDDMSPVWQTITEKCQEGLRFPLAARDRTSYDLSVEDITRRKSKQALNGTPTLRVRFFKKGTSLSTGLLWDKVNDPSYKRSFHYLPSASAADVLLEICSKAQKENAETVIIRTDSTRLMRTVESWMPTWKQIGWRSALHQKIVDWDKWDTIDRNLDNIQVYWELMDPPSEEDILALTELREKKKRRSRKKADAPISLTDVISGRRISK